MEGEREGEDGGKEKGKRGQREGEKRRGRVKEEERRVRGSDASWRGDGRGDSGGECKWGEAGARASLRRPVLSLEGEMKGLRRLVSSPETR